MTSPPATPAVAVLLVAGGALAVASGVLRFFRQDRAASSLLRVAAGCWIGALAFAVPQ